MTFDLSSVELFELSPSPNAVGNPQLVADAAGGFDLAYYMSDQGAGSYRWGRAPSGAAFGDPSNTTFEPSLATTVAAVDFDVSLTDSTRLGDYTGLAATATTLFTSYVDNASGASHIRVHVAPLP